MKLEFDPAKSAKNAVERDLPFGLVAELDWERAVTFLDDRFDYGEVRIGALVPWKKRLYAVCYQIRGENRRVISFRKANKREERAYEQATTDR